MALAEYIYFMGFKLDWASDPDQSSASEPDQENIIHFMGSDTSPSARFKLLPEIIIPSAKDVCSLSYYYNYFTIESTPLSSEVCNEGLATLSLYKV